MTKKTTNPKKIEILDVFNSHFPLLEKMYEVYEFSGENLKEDSTLRRSVECNLLEALELTVIASRQQKEHKKETLRQIGVKLDTLKVYIDLAKQTLLINEKVAGKIFVPLNEVARMVDAWKKKLEN